MTKPPPIWIKDVNVLMPVENRERNVTLSKFHNKSMETPHVHYPNKMRVTIDEFDERYQAVLRGSSDGAVARALASHKCRPRSIPARCHIMWVEFAVGSRLVPNYRELQQPNSTRIDDPHKNQLRLI